MSLVNITNAIELLVRDMKFLKDETISMNSLLYKIRGSIEMIGHKVDGMLQNNVIVESGTTTAKSIAISRPQKKLNLTECEEKLKGLEFTFDCVLKTFPLLDKIS